MNLKGPNNFVVTGKFKMLSILFDVVVEHLLDYNSFDVETAFLYPPLHPDDTLSRKSITISQISIFLIPRNVCHSFETF